MIRRFQHRGGLSRLYENDDRRGVNSELVEKAAQCWRGSTLRRGRNSSSYQALGSTGSKATSQDTGASPFEVIGELSSGLTKGTPPTLI
jgi:hypothetical protein